MDIDAKTFAIISLTIIIVVPLVWDWITDLLDELDREYWEDIEKTEDEEPDRHKCGKK